MAQTGEPDNAFVREVDEEYRRAQMQSFWQRYGRWLLAALALGLVALGGWLYWREEQGRTAGRDGEAFTEALAKVEAGDFAAARPTLDRLAKSGSPGYQGLARLELAALAAQTGDTAAALTQYRAAAADAALPQPFRDLALVRSVRLDFDNLPPEKAIAALRPLAVPGNPWFGSAGEMVGAAYLKQGKPELAEPIFRAIAADTGVSPTLRARAGQLASAMGRVPAPSPSLPSAKAP